MEKEPAGLKISLGLLVAQAGGLLPVFVLAGIMPNNMLLPDLASHFMAQYALCAIVLAALAVWLKAPKPILALLCLSFCLSFYQLIPFLPLGVATAEPQKTLKILSANVLFINKDTAQLKTLIALENPDVVVTQETSSAFAEMLATLKKDYPYQDIHPEENGPRGLGVISRLPLDKAARIFFDNKNVPAHLFRLRHDGKDISFISIHPFTPTQSIERRDSEFRHIADMLKKKPLKNMVLLGDFNASPFCQAYKRLAGALQLKNAREGRGVMPTWPSFLPTPFLRIPIDHVLVDRNIAVRDFRVLNGIGSDHMPVIAEIAVKGGT